MAHSYTEENYLKHIYKLSRKTDKGVSTNALAERLDTKASSVTDMIKKLAAKKLVNYQKYQGVTLSKKGQRIAVDIIRKHRLWEVFLLEHLGFGWDEVHEVAEELEHINSHLSGTCFSWLFLNFFMLRISFPPSNTNLDFYLKFSA